MYTQQHHHTTALFLPSHQAVFLILNPWLMFGRFCSGESEVWIDFFTRLCNWSQLPSSWQWQHDALSSSFVCRLFSLLLILYFLLSLLWKFSDQHTLIRKFFTDLSFLQVYWWVKSSYKLHILTDFFHQSEVFSFYDVISSHHNKGNRRLREEFLGVEMMKMCKVGRN